MQAGFIGLGAMGANMARNVAKAGLLKAVWNRTGIVAETLSQELQVNHAATPSELANQVDVVLTCVSTDDDLLAVIEAMLPGLNSNSIVIDHSTVSAETARKVAAIVKGSGAEFLDAPVSGGVEGAKNGTLAIMVGGPIESLNQAKAVLEAMSGRIVHMGDVGAGQATKAINQIMCAGINQAVTEALAFGATQGVNLEKAIDIIRQGAAGNWFLDKRGLTMVNGVFTPGFKLALHQKDLKICLEMAEKLGVNLPITQITSREYAQLIQQGYGDEDISALYRLKRK